MLVPIHSKPVDALKAGACRRWRECRPAVAVPLRSEDAVYHLLVVGPIFKFAQMAYTYNEVRRTSMHFLGVGAPLPHVM